METSEISSLSLPLKAIPPQSVDGHAVKGRLEWDIPKVKAMGIDPDLLPTLAEVLTRENEAATREWKIPKVNVVRWRKLDG